MQRRHRPEPTPGFRECARPPRQVRGRTSNVSMPPPIQIAQDASVRAARADAGGTPRKSLLLRLGWPAALWLVLALLSTWVLMNQGVPIAARKPLLAVAIAATAGVVGLAIAHLGAVRFLVLGSRFDLYAGLAFGVLAFTNLGLGVVRPIADLSPLTPDISTYTVLFGQGIATVLFLLGLAGASQVVAPAARRRFGWKRGLVVTVVLVM